MGVVVVLLSISLLLASAGVAAFVWAARGRQFDGVEVSAARLLWERDEAPPARPPAAPAGEGGEGA